jgi:hypothetical protein
MALARCDHGAIKLFEYADENVRGAISLISAPAMFELDDKFCFGHVRLLTDRRMLFRFP